MAKERIPKSPETSADVLEKPTQEPTGAVIDEPTELEAKLEWFKSSDDVRKGYARGATFGSKEVEFSVIDHRAMFEGDICLGTADSVEAQPPELDPAQATARGIAHGVGITGEEYRWPNGVIPFEIDSTLSGQTQSIINDAINHWHQNTNIRLVPRTTQRNYLRFIDGGGCWSYVGMRGGLQQISIGRGCGFGAAVHEIGHAVGLWHEQSREDRARHVRILWQNVQQGREHNFNQHISDGDDIGGYDFGSIMHYGRFAFSKNGRPTIETTSGQQIGQRSGLSAGDIQAVRALYPQIEPPPQTSRLFRYWGNSDHFYTTNWNELGGGRSGYRYEGVQCYIHPNPATGTTPLFRYYNGRIRDHFYTTNWRELRAGRSGYVLEGIQGYVYPRATRGTVRLYRYWNSRIGDHFYTTSWSELGSGRQGYRYEGVQCYVYRLPPASAEEAAEATDFDAESDVLLPVSAMVEAVEELEPSEMEVNISSSGEFEDEFGSFGPEAELLESTTSEAGRKISPSITLKIDLGDN